MKKLTVFSMVLLFLIFLLPITSNALPDNPNVFTVPITINWVDYDNFLGQRPDSITMKLIDWNTWEEFEVTLYAKDCQTVRVDDKRTQWVGELELPKYSAGGITSYGMVEGSWGDDIGGYNITEQSAQASSEYPGGGEIKVFIAADLTRKYYFIVNWDDDTNRDGLRSWDTSATINMINNKNEVREVSIFGEDDVNQWQTSEYFPTYLFDENNVPIWDEKIEYRAELNSYKDHGVYEPVYQSDITVNDNIVTINLKHEPYRLDYDVPVKVEWEENDKDYIPENISIKILNKYTKQEYGEAQLSKDTNWEHAFKNLFERENGHIITYTIQVADAKNCEFEVTGSQEEGFTILGKYKEEPVEEVPQNPDENERKDETEQNANTTNTVEEASIESKVLDIKSPKTGGGNATILAIAECVLLILITLAIVLVILIRKNNAKIKNK